MKNREHILYIVSLVVILVNFLDVLFYYRMLPDIMPLHYDLEGNYTSTMKTWILFLYPLASLMMTGLVYLAGRIISKASPKRNRRYWKRSLAVLSLCICLTVFASTGVTLSAGSNHLFMFAEPVLMLTGIVFVAAAEIRIRKIR